MISNMSLSIFNFQLFCVHVCVFLASIGVASFCLIWQAVFSSPSYVSCFPMHMFVLKTRISFGKTRALYRHLDLPLLTLEYFLQNIFRVYLSWRNPSEVLQA